MVNTFSILKLELLLLEKHNENINDQDKIYGHMEGSSQMQPKNKQHPDRTTPQESITWTLKYQACGMWGMNSSPKWSRVREFPDACIA